MAVLTFDVDAETPILAEGRRYARHPMVMSHQAYGPDVGLPRILRLLEEYGLPATFFVPGLTAELHPAVVPQILDAGHEVGHHSYSHRLPTALSEGEERRDFERALAVLEGAGASVTGHRTPLSAASPRTPGLVAEHGLRYQSVLMDDDRPYVLETDHGDIAELPPHWSLDDWLQYAYLPDPPIGRQIKSPDEVLPGWIDELDAMRRYGCLYVLTMHPFVTGRPSRIEALRALIETALERGDVGFASCEEVAGRVLDDRTSTRRSFAALRRDPDPAVYPEP